MHNSRKKSWRYGLVLLAFLVGGCDDTEKLGRVFRLAGDRFGQGMQQAWSRVAPRWQKMRGTPEQLLQERVEGRLAPDRVLSGATIKVHVTGTTVELSGTIQKEEQRRQAVTLAEGTVGVERVVDHLEVATP